MSEVLLSNYLIHLTAGLSYDTNEIALRDAFAEHGEVVEGKYVCF